MNALTSVGLVELLGEKHRRRLEDLVRAPELVVLLAQAPDLLALLRREQLRSGAAVGLGAPHALAQRLRVDAQIVGDVRDRPVAFQREAHASRDQLIGILLRTGHGDGASPPARTESSHRSLRETRPCSVRQAPALAAAALSAQITPVLRQCASSVVRLPMMRYGSACEASSRSALASGGSCGVTSPDRRTRARRRLLV